MPNDQTVAPMTPPPDPSSVDMKSTVGDKIGGFLGAISGGGLLGSISDALDRSHQKRVAKAKMYHDVMVEKLSHPAYGDENDPDHQKTQDAYNAAKEEYLKALGDKDAKKQAQQRIAIAEHHVASQGQGQGQGAGAGADIGGDTGTGTPPMGPPPAATQPQASASPSTAPSSPSFPPTAGSQPPTASTPAAAGGNAVVPPPPTPTKPDMTDIIAGVPGERQADASKRALDTRQKEVDMDTQAKIKEAQAKPPSAASKGAPHVITRNIAGKDLDSQNVMQLNGEPLDPDQHYDLLRNPDGTMVGIPSAAAKETAYNLMTELHKEHPDWPPEKISQAVQAQKQTGLGTYAMVRLLDFAAKYDPELLTTMPEIFAKMGITLPGGAKVSAVPPGMPTDENGKPIGLGMPGAPTGPTRGRGQLAEGMIEEIPGIKKEISDMGDQLGPVMGRWNEFMTGKVGGDPDDPNYAKYQALRTDMLLLSSGAAKMHLNSVRAVDEFNAMAATGKMTPAVLNAFIDTVEKWAKTYAKQGRGQTLTPPPAPGAASGTTKLTSNGRTYNIPNAQVEEFKKDHPNAVAAR